MGVLDAGRPNMACPQALQPHIAGGYSPGGWPSSGPERSSQTVLDFAPRSDRLRTPPVANRFDKERHRRKNSRHPATPISCPHRSRRLNRRQQVNLTRVNCLSLEARFFPRRGVFDLASAGWLRGWTEQVDATHVLFYTAARTQRLARHSDRCRCASHWQGRAHRRRFTQYSSR